MSSNILNPCDDSFGASASNAYEIEIALSEFCQHSDDRTTRAALAAPFGRYSFWIVHLFY